MATVFVAGNPPLRPHGVRWTFVTLLILLMGNKELISSSTYPPFDVV